MSGIAGVVDFDGRPVDRAALGRLASAAPHRGPDGTSIVVDGAVGMVHQALRTIPPAGAGLPLVDASTKRMLTFDGRLDDRNGLIADLDLDSRTPSLSDASLVMRAYDRWGATCPEHLVGDFAFAVWDGPRRRIVCARDPLGVRPFCYWTDGRVLIWASEQR